MYSCCSLSSVSDIARDFLPELLLTYGSDYVKIKKSSPNAEKKKDIASNLSFQLFIFHSVFLWMIIKSISLLDIHSNPWNRALWSNTNNTGYEDGGFEYSEDICKDMKTHVLARGFLDVLISEETTGILC